MAFCNPQTLLKGRRKCRAEPGALETRSNFTPRACNLGLNLPVGRLVEGGGGCRAIHSSLERSNLSTALRLAFKWCGMGGRTRGRTYQQCGWPGRFACEGGMRIFRTEVGTSWRRERCCRHVGQIRNVLWKVCNMLDFMWNPRAQKFMEPDFLEFKSLKWLQIYKTKVQQYQR